MNKRFWIPVTLALASLSPGIAQAICTLNGVVVRVTAYDDAYSATGGYIYFRTSSLASYYYYVVTNDDETISNAIAYMNSGRTATISGSTAACPAVPAAGGGAFLGTLNYIYNP